LITFTTYLDWEGMKPFCRYYTRQQRGKQMVNLT